MESKVKAFHKKHGFPIGVKLEGGRSDVDLKLAELSVAIKKQTKDLATLALKAESHGDNRLYRSYLILEEVYEILEALVTCDEIELADGLGDLYYVVAGTAVTYNIPLKEVAKEIHRSNMTKAKRDIERDPRMRNKGGKYEAPNIEQVLGGRKC